MLFRIGQIISFLIIASLFVVQAMEGEKLSPDIRKVREGLYETKVMRGKTPIYFYHQKVSTEEEYSFWCTYRRKEYIGCDTRGLPLMYRVVLEQGNPTCEYTYKESDYEFLKKVGIENPQQHLKDLRENCLKRGITTKDLENLLEGHAAGNGAFEPCGYVVFVCKDAIEAPYVLDKNEAFTSSASNPSNQAKFKNILACYASSVQPNGAIEHRGIFKPLQDLLFPNQVYRGIGIMAHVFGTEVERTVLGCNHLFLRPLAHMLLMMANEFPGHIIHGDARAYFYQNIGKLPYADVLQEALRLNEPLDLEPLKKTGCEQSGVVIDMKPLSERFQTLFKQ